jgi:phosphoglucosamine mutase
MLDHATTGDGLLTALHFLAAAAHDRVPVAALANVMTRYPQVLVNVSGVDKARVTAAPAVTAEIAGAEAELGESGRVLVRPSGTEPAVRIMVEAVDADLAERIAQRLVAAVRAAA